MFKKIIFSLTSILFLVGCSSGESGDSGEDINELRNEIEDVVDRAGNTSTVGSNSDVIEKDEEYGMEENKKIENYVMNKPEKIHFSDETVDLIPVGLDENGFMKTVEGVVDFAWYDVVGKGVKNQIVAGHRDWNGEVSYLFNMGDWELGKQITMEYGNGEEVFELVEVERFTYKEHGEMTSYLSMTEGEYRVTVISCIGDYIEGYGYEERVFGVFELVD